MGIDYNGGRLPFFMDAEVFVNELNEKVDELQRAHEELKKQKIKVKPFDKTVFLYENGWSIQYEGIVIDDIFMGATLRKDKYEVYTTYLCLITGDDGIVVSKDEESLKAFKKDFKIKSTIYKNEKVVQIN